MQILQFVNSIPPAALADAFDRTASNGWGVLDGATATMRPPWGFEGGAASNFSVASGTGRISITAVNTLYSMIVSTRVVEFDTTVTVTVPVVATGGPIYVGLMAPYQDGPNNYKSEILFGTGGALDVRIRRTVAGTATTLATASAGTYTATSSWKLRYQFTGGNTWRAKVWAAAGSEPAAWTVTATDTPTFGFGRPGISAVADAANTNTLPLLIQVDDYSLTPSPGVRLDLNDHIWWWLAPEGLRFDPPPLRRAVAQTLLRDGSTYPAAAYDDRTLQLKLMLVGGTADQHADAVIALARELDRPSNILRWWPDGATKPVYFRTVRSPAAAVLDQLKTGDTRRNIDLEIVAEPFALGEQQILAPLNVTNDPATGITNPTWVEIPAAQVLGDVEAPLIVRADAIDVAGRQSLLAVRRRRLVGLFHKLDMEAGTNVNDTSEPGNDPVMAGTGNNYTRTTFATVTSMVNRVTFAQFPITTLASSAYRGTYRVFLRYRKSVATDVIRVRLLWGGTTTTTAIVGPTTTLAQTTSRRYADLGQVSLPPGADPMTEGYSGLLWQASALSVAVQAERASGTGNLDMNILVFVPSDEKLCLVSWPDPLTGYAVVDGIREMAYEQSLDDAGTGPGPIGDALGIPVVGMFPAFTPGVDNRLHVMSNVGTTGVQDSITDHIHLTIAYWPRYLYVRGTS